MQAFQDPETVINVIDTVVCGTEKFQKSVAGMQRETARR